MASRPVPGTDTPGFGDGGRVGPRGRPATHDVKGAALSTLRILLATLALATAAEAQTILLSEDFDAGIPPTWTNIQLGYTGDIWQPGFHLIDGTADVNHEYFCDFGFFFRNNILLSPVMDFTDVTNATFQCDQFHNFSSAILYNAIEVTTNGGANYTIVHQVVAPGDGVSSIQVDLDAFAGQPSVQVALHYQGVIANDWSVDNIVVKSPWVELGNGLGGALGVPLLQGSGSLQPGSSVALSLSGAPPSASAYLVVGLATINAPFKGGVLVPEVDHLITLATNAGGALPILAPWIAGIPPDFTTYFQYWVADASGPSGFVASNGISGTTP